MLREYHESQLECERAVALVNIRKVQAYKGLKQPTQSEVNVGLCLMLIMSSVDGSIRLNHDKTQLLDKSWNTSIAKYYTNSGKVVQNVRKLRDVIDYERLGLGLASSVMNMDIAYSELKGEGSIALFECLNALRQRIDLNKKSKILLTQ